MLAACGSNNSKDSSKVERGESAQILVVDAGVKTDVPECDQAIDKYLRCLDSMPPDHREQMKARFLEQAASWRAAAAQLTDKREMAASCKAQEALMRKATEAAGCRW